MSYDPATSEYAARRAPETAVGARSDAASLDEHGSAGHVGLFSGSGLAVLRLDGLFELVSLVAAERHDRRQRAAQGVPSKDQPTVAPARSAARRITSAHCPTTLFRLFS